MGKSKVFSNTVMLYIMSIAKLIFPLLTLPYLTRVLSEDAYGFVSYVKSCMTYMQLIVDFGFILSSVKDIVNANGDLKKIGTIAGNTVAAKLILTLAAGVVLVVMCFAIKILQLNILFVVLSFITVALTAFLADFLFRGIEKMHYISIIFVITKAISTAMTFVMVKGDDTMMWIPVLDILANVIAVGITVGILAKLQIRIYFSGIRDCLSMIKDSFAYFLSSVATTAFAALNTLIIGIYMTDLTLVAYWSLSLNIISAIQGLYAPICNSVYPHMIRERSLKFIHRIMAIFMPIVTLGCVFCFFAAEPALLIIGGEKYVAATTIFKWMIPILFFSFPAQMYGWPTLGAVGKVKETTLSTIIAAVAQVVGLLALAFSGYLTLVSMAILRFSTEALMMVIRMWFTYNHHNDFKRITSVENAN
ncbi:MAG: oligosaccharide flippase family protein [Clostridia bacterium]|nr:oligosaccharide flippase family protein [Clostridia bacterium]